MKAPFTQYQVDQINAYQECAYVHPLTCSCSNDLIADKSGLHCHECQYTQDWVPDAVMEIDWLWLKDMGKI